MSFPRLLTPLLCLLGTLSFTSLPAQTYELPKESWHTVANFGTIRAGEDIAGYFILTTRALDAGKDPNLKATGKASGVTFVLTLLDQNLNQIGEQTLPYSPKMNIRSVVYSGKYLGVWVTEDNDQRIDFVTAAGETERSVELKSLSTWEIDPLTLSRLASLNYNLRATPDGLIYLGQDTHPDKERRRANFLRFFPNDGGEGWTVPLSLDFRMTQGGNILSVSDDLVFVHSFDTKGDLMIMERPFEQNLTAYELATGKEAFTVPNPTDYGVHWMAARDLGDEIHFIGPLTAAPGTLVRTKYIGLRRVKVDRDGRVLTREDLHFDDAFFAEFEREGQLGVHKRPQLYIHDVSIDPTGAVFVTAEAYSKKGGKINTGEGVILHIDPDFSAAHPSTVGNGVNLKMAPNTYNQAAMMMTPADLAFYAMMERRFDYRFSRQGTTSNMAVYLPGNDQLEDDKSPRFYVASSRSGDLHTELMTFPEEISFAVALPAKDGFIGVVVKNEESGTLEMRLKRIGAR